jgi:cation:H+ antiporter
MDLCLNIFYLLLGSAGLYFGADFLVAGGVAIAKKAGVSSLVIGLTLVAFATSAPELVVSVSAALSKNPSISLGNVIGSNVFNIAVILGLCAVINPIRVQMQSIKFDAPIMILASLVLTAFYFYFQDHTLSRWQGVFLFAGLIAYTLWSIITSRKEQSNTENVNETNPPKSMNIFKAIALVCIGFAGLIIGAKCFLWGAIFIAKLCNMPEAVIGLTIVAAGTSLPELATSIVAAIKHEDDIAIGNVIGSNIFNILCILGITAMICPLEGATLSILDFNVMIGISILLFFMMLTGRKISRIEGGILVFSFIAYTTYLITTM